MIHLPASVRVYLLDAVRHAQEFRQSAGACPGGAWSWMPPPGHLFVLYEPRKDRVKILYWG
jgi:hypothetical protein